MRLLGLVPIFSRIEKKLNQIFDVLQLLVSFHREREQISPVIWLDNQDVMLMLKISERTLRRRRLEGRIPFRQVKGKYYYKQVDIDEMLGSGGKKFESI